MFSIDRLHRDIVIRCDWRWLLCVVSLFLLASVTVVASIAYSNARYYHNQCFQISLSNSHTLMECKVDAAIASQNLERYIAQVNKIVEAPAVPEIRGVQIPVGGIGGDEEAFKRLNKEQK